MIDTRRCGYGTLGTTTVRIWHRVTRRAPQRSQLRLKSPAALCRALSSCKRWLFYKSNLVASWMHLHESRCSQEHPRILSQSLRALGLAAGGPGSIWKYLDALVRSTGVSGRFACGSWTDLHFADEDPSLISMGVQSLYWRGCEAGRWDHRSGSGDASAES